MKKTYIKPCVFREEYILSQMIAGSCDSGLKVNSSGYDCFKTYYDTNGGTGNPIIDMIYQDSLLDGGKLFSGGVGGCSEWYGEDTLGGLCYQNSGLVVFSS
ncbi:MAG: hypothetical protein E7269_05070 [Lachnospiraceae bacterium]|nr:hypothetical protein [Lachnospiraceae bacterium]